MYVNINVRNKLGWDISSNLKSKKKAHQVAKRPPAGKQKLSGVTSGYGGLMIQFGRIHLTTKNGIYMDVAKKKMKIFGPKMGLGGRPDTHCATGSTQKPCLFGVPS